MSGQMSDLSMKSCEHMYAGIKPALKQRGLRIYNPMSRRNADSDEWKYDHPKTQLSKAYQHPHHFKDSKDTKEDKDNEIYEDTVSRRANKGRWKRYYDAKEKKREAANKKWKKIRKEELDAIGAEYKMNENQEITAVKYIPPAPLSSDDQSMYEHEANIIGQKFMDGMIYDAAMNSDSEIVTNSGFVHQLFARGMNKKRMLLRKQGTPPPNLIIDATKQPHPKIPIGKVTVKDLSKNVFAYDDEHLPLDHGSHHERDIDERIYRRNQIDHRYGTSNGALIDNVHPNRFRVLDQNHGNKTCKCKECILRTVFMKMKSNAVKAKQSRSIQMEAIRQNNIKKHIKQRQQRKPKWKGSRGYKMMMAAQKK